jgi:hypothetical protein
MPAAAIHSRVHMSATAYGPGSAVVVRKMVELNTPSLCRLDVFAWDMSPIPHAIAVRGVCAEGNRCSRRDVGQRLEYVHHMMVREREVACREMATICVEDIGILADSGHRCSLC